jgi:hypothetical protein
MYNYTQFLICFVTVSQKRLVRKVVGFSSEEFNYYGQLLRECSGCQWQSSITRASG